MVVFFSECNSYVFCCFSNDFEKLQNTFSDPPSLHSTMISYSYDYDSRCCCNDVDIEGRGSSLGDPPQISTYWLIVVVVATTTTTTTTTIYYYIAHRNCYCYLLLLHHSSFIAHDTRHADR